MTNMLWNLLDELDEKGFRKMIGGKDYLKTWKFIEENLFKLK
jgi:hypothetical protein